MKNDATRSRTNVVIPAVCIGILVSLAILCASWFDLFARLDYMCADVFSRSRRVAYTPADSDILIVAIDQASLTELGSWPWSRGLHARLIKKLADWGSGVIGIGILFGEEGSDTGADASLADEIRSAGRTVMPVYYEEVRIGSQVAQDYYYPMKALLDAGVALGTINLRPDADGVLRRVRMKKENLADRAWPYAIEMVKLYKGLRDADIHLQKGGTVFSIGETTVPLVGRKDMYINFRGPARSFPHLSYATVMRDGYDPALFKGKIVLVGATAPGLRTDHFHTPFTTLLPGVEAHANIIDTLLKRDFLRDMTVRNWILLVSLVSFAAALVFMVAGWKLAVAALLCFILMTWYASFFIFSQYCVYVPTVSLFFTVMFCFVSAVVYKYVYAERSSNVQHLDLHSLYEVGKETMHILPPQQVMNFILEMLVPLMSIDAALIVMRDKKTAGMYVGAVRGDKWFADRIVPGQAFQFHRSIMEYIDSKREALVLGSSLQRKRALGEAGEADPRLRSRAYVPLMSHDAVIGILALYKKKKHAFDQYAVQTLFIIASQVAIAIKNYELFDDLQKSFKDTVRGLVSAVDEKDPYTRGHSERVAQYAVAVGRELGFDAAHLESLEYAALLHDIGKISVDLMILRKEKGLSEKEFDLMRHHPAAGTKILEPIHFLSRSLPGIRHHHERYNGTGYPDGLKADEIPIDACIISVADAFDAMTTHRAYSTAKPLAAALEILAQNSGVQFHPKIVDAFTKVFNEKFAEQFQQQQSQIQPQEKYEDPSV